MNYFTSTRIKIEFINGSQTKPKAFNGEQLSNIRSRKTNELAKREAGVGSLKLKEAILRNKCDLQQHAPSAPSLNVFRLREVGELQKLKATGEEACT